MLKGVTAPLVCALHDCISPKLMRPRKVGFFAFVNIVQFFYAYCFAVELAAHRV